MSTNIVKATEIAGAYDYPSNRLNQRERKVLEVAEEYAPADSDAWGSSVPSTLSGALDSLAASVNPTEFGMVTTSVVWDFSVNGGAISTIPLDGSLPDNAVIVEVVRDVLVAPDSADDLGTIQLNVPTNGNLDSAITANGAATSLAIFDTTPTKLTAARVPQVTIATSAITVGKVRWYIRYYRGE